MQVFGIERKQFFVIVSKRRRAVFMLEIQIRAQPVEHGHKIITNAPDADFSAVDDILLVRFDILVSRRFAEFYVFVHGDGLDNFHIKPRIVCKIFEPFKFFFFPDFSDGRVVNGGHNPAHSLYLFYVIQRYAIVFSIPAEGHFHSPKTSFTLLYAISFASASADFSSYSPWSTLSAINDESILR